MKSLKSICVALCAALVLAGCGMSKTGQGALIGGGGGAALGAIIGALAGNAAIGTAIGGAVGLVRPVSQRVGREMAALLRKVIRLHRDGKAREERILHHGAVRVDE